MKLTDEEDDEIYDEINQCIHALVFLSHHCQESREGHGDRETIREHLEGLEGRLKRIREICGLRPADHALYMRYLGTLGILAEVSIQVEEEDRETIERAFEHACSHHPLQWRRILSRLEIEGKSPA